MEQTVLRKENERLTLSLSIRQKSGYGLAKDVAKKFGEEKIKYTFSKSKFSVMYNFGNWYIKIFYPFYEDGKVEICVYKMSLEIKKVLDLVMGYITKVVVPSQKNNLFLTLHTTFESLNTSICVINKKSYTDYSFVQEGNMYNINTKTTYSLKAERMNTKRIKCTDSLVLSMKVDSIGLIGFVPNFFAKFFSEADKSRKEILEKIED